ncbi:hypothetical protein EVAR_16232_1 [Eumeta japonica]|uniref:Uncharacterized protein n=1 Tax=Eumeta variegata TaxID=151549 RepID=A0A4C1U6V9_EUMVA|nr:hypothetical protein EVAR_16232_1 [Eumeta japonica]
MRDESQSRDRDGTGMRGGAGVRIERETKFEIDSNFDQHKTYLSEQFLSGFTQRHNPSLPALSHLLLLPGIA